MPRGPDAIGITAVTHQGLFSSAKKAIPSVPIEGRVRVSQETADRLLSLMQYNLQGGNLKVLRRAEKQQVIAIDPAPPTFVDNLSAILINARGIPTTESGVTFGQLTSDEIQPFMVRTVVDGASTTVKAIVAHNGTIANDAELAKGQRWMTGAAMRLRYPKGDIDSYSLMTHLVKNGKCRWNSKWEDAFGIEGSYALATWTQKQFMLTRNYLGLHCLTVVLKNGSGYLFFSSEPFDTKVFGYSGVCASNKVESVCPFELPPYSYVALDVDKGLMVGNFNAYDHATWIRDKIVVFGEKTLEKKRALVILSGGLDSTVTATKACTDFKQVHLLHFDYGCRATTPEAEAVFQIHRALMQQFPDNVITLKIVDMLWLKGFGGSRLTQDEDTIVDGDRGAELSTEWVPARNLCMASVAAAYCDANEIGTIMLGVNREESASYSDNSTEFYDALNRALELGTSSRPRIVSPLGNMMKHHIVALGIQLKAPLQYTWSCYRAGVGPHKLRCGRCGPCLNTARAFVMNDIKMPFEYADSFLIQRMRVKQPKKKV